MKTVAVAFSVVLLQIVGCSNVQYEIPEPVFEVFTPKGLKVSVPDSRDVKSVEFFLTVPSHPDPLIQEVKNKNGSHWIYWNPDVVLNLYEKIQYKIMIQLKDFYWKKEGNYVVQKVQFLNGTNCPESEGQKTISSFPSMANTEKRLKGALTTGKTLSYKSSYSTQKKTDLKPITKSSTSTTSGTFYVKPSGVMEATGYKAGSTFDSTKKEGEQWQHYESELTAEELENMRRLYGTGFSHLTDKLFPTSAKMYEKSYMSSESKSFPAEFRSAAFEEKPVTTQQFHQFHKSHESVSHSRPVFQFHYNDGLGSHRQVEKLYKAEPFQLPNPLPPQGTIFKTTEYVREEHTLPDEDSQVIVTNENRRSSSPQKLVQLSQGGEFSNSEFHNQEIVKPVFAHVVSNGGKAGQLEYNAGNVQTIEKQDYRSRVYLGPIFTSVKTSKVKSPSECSLVPGIDYIPNGNIRDLEKYAYELSCLATLAESTVKEEIALLKQKNAEINRNLELLKHEVKRLSGGCNCYE